MLPENMMDCLDDFRPAPLGTSDGIVWDGESLYQVPLSPSGRSTASAPLESIEHHEVRTLCASIGGCWDGKW